MDFEHSPRARDYTERVGAFVRDRIRPVEAAYLQELHALVDPWVVLPVVHELKAAARDSGLWNLFLPDEEHGVGLSNLEYAPVAEAMGGSVLAPEVFNCNAPDTGNMEVLLRYGSAEHQERWLRPLLAGEIRSTFCMSEPDVASSDATTMATTAIVDGDDVVVSGRKWWSTGIGHPDCALLIVMALTEADAPRHQRHSMVIVPRHADGVAVERMLPHMGRYDEPYGHGVVRFDGVRVPASDILVGPGQGFAIAQGRLGPGRIHHCMRTIGLAERALQLACERATSRVAFGRPLADLGGNRERIAEARIAIEQARLLVLHAAWLLDTAGTDAAAGAVSQIKVAVPAMAQGVVDMAIQLHGAAGLSDDFPLAHAWAQARALRLADGPDEVHRDVVARRELARYGRPAVEGGGT